MAKLDLKRFRQDLKTARSGREADAADRPAATGAMAVVRENLDLFDRMRAEDPTLTWSDIAVSLGKQGVRQRDGEPISPKRLCALISTIRRQQAAKVTAAAGRANRLDVAGVNRRTPAPARERRLALAPDLVEADSGARPKTSTSEQDRRHAALDRAKTFIRKD